MPETKLDAEAEAAFAEEKIRAADALTRDQKLQCVSVCRGDLDKALKLWEWIRDKA